MSAWDTEFEYLSTSILWSYSFLGFDWFDFLGMVAISLDSSIWTDGKYPDTSGIDDHS